MTLTFESRRRGNLQESRIHDVCLDGKKIGGVRKVLDDEWSGWLDEDEVPPEPENEETADPPELALYPASHRQLTTGAKRPGALFAPLTEAEVLASAE